MHENDKIDDALGYWHDVIYNPNYTMSYDSSRHLYFTRYTRLDRTKKYYGIESVLKFVDTHKRYSHTDDYMLSDIIDTITINATFMTDDELISLSCIFSEDISVNICGVITKHVAKYLCDNYGHFKYDVKICTFIGDDYYRFSNSCIYEYALMLDAPLIVDEYEHLPYSPHIYGKLTKLKFIVTDKSYIENNIIIDHKTNLKDIDMTIVTCVSIDMHGMTQEKYDDIISLMMDARDHTHCGKIILISRKDGYTPDITLNRIGSIEYVIAVE
jgi:hypothetical protein